MRIQITAGTTTLNATLDDSTVARDFAAMLPLTLTLRDFHSTEKIANLPRTLRTAGSPSGTAAQSGDTACYGPWGNLAIFYRDFEYSAGLVSLGHIDEHLGALTASTDGPTITIAAAE
jgi:hypothetical protein